MLIVDAVLLLIGVLGVGVGVGMLINERSGR